VVVTDTCADRATVESLGNAGVEVVVA
jgi:hypothetical protein